MPTGSVPSRVRLAAVALLGALAFGQTAPNPSRNYFTDTIVKDQNGVDRRFYTDLIAGKVVVINVMFATCKDSCPVMARNFKHIQDWLGSRLGSDANMISITIDPETDTPSRLKEYAEKNGSRPGWYFLTGSKENVDLLLRKLGLYADRKEDHLNLFLIGNDRTGLWKKAFGMASPDQLLPIVDSVLRDGSGTH